MAQIIGAFRLGRDAELRRTQNGDAVAGLALAFNYGRKDDAGNRPSQWIEASLWGKRAEALVPYLLKGQQIYAVLDEPHIETYEGKNGQGVKLVARVLELELIGGRPQGEAAPRQQQAPRQQPRNEYAAARGTQQPRQASSGFDDMDDETIPF